MILDENFDSEINQATIWFPHVQDSPFILIRVSEEHAKSWLNVIPPYIRRCYVSDALLTERATSTGASIESLIAAKLPDPGSTMAGDFGEILTYLYQASKEIPSYTVGPMKWRLKQDRKKPAPYSDVVHFVFPSWPSYSDLDKVVCSEVKTKSTDGQSTPIVSAIEDCEIDRISRLAKTLVWLRERALFESIGDTNLAILQRFIDATQDPPAQKQFRAVAIVCNSLVADEILSAPSITSSAFTLVVIVVPKLKEIYSGVFEAAQKYIAVDETPPPVASD